MRKPFTMLIALLAAGLASAPVLADRQPTEEERAKIEQFLKEQGYVSWGEIEFDDGMWEVDDAKTADGTVYDIDLESETLRIIEVDRDERSFLEGPDAEPRP